MSKELLQFLETKQLPGRMLVAKVWGSRSHNTELPTSDWDFTGVWIAPTDAVLGLEPIVETMQHEGPDKPDYAFHEVGKFCRMLCKGNPGVVEMLCTEKLIVWHPVWETLRKERARFLTQQSVNQYIQYAKSQLKRLANDQSLHTTGSSYNTKWAYHLLRILKDAQRIVEGDEPQVWKEGEEREFLMKVRHGDFSQDSIALLASDLVNDLEDGLDSTDIPELPDVAWLNDWLVKLRKADGV